MTEKSRLLLVLNLGWGAPARLRDAALDFRLAVEQAAGAKPLLVEMSHGMAFTVLAVATDAGAEAFLDAVRQRLRAFFNFGSGFDAGQDGISVISYDDCAATDGERLARLLM
jgi:hypothetical protein